LSFKLGRVVSVTLKDTVFPEISIPFESGDGKSVVFLSLCVIEVTNFVKKQARKK